MTRDGANPGSIKLRYETLSRLLQAAVDAELIKRSPCYRVGLPRYEAGEMRLLTISEIVALADTIHPRYRALVVVAGTAGLRIGELGAVRGRRVDLARGTIAVVENLALDNGKPVLGPVKTKASNGRYRSPVRPSRPSASTSSGTPSAPTTSCSRLRRATCCAPTSSGAATSTPRPRRPGWILCARTTFGTRRSHCGLPVVPIPKVVQVKAGHSSISVTYDRYGHLFPDYDDRTTRHLENLWDGMATDKVVAIPRRRSS